jgi:hypothetical protein
MSAFFKPSARFRRMNRDYSGGSTPKVPRPDEEGEDSLPLLPQSEVA